MFVNNNELLDAKVYWKKIKNKYQALTESEMIKKQLNDEDIKKFNVLNIRAIGLSWGLYNQLQEDALDVDGDNKRFNVKKFKENKLKKTIKEWDAKTDKGEPIPVNEKTILSMTPAVAEAILRAYDELTFLTEEDEKN